MAGSYWKDHGRMSKTVAYKRPDYKEKKGRPRKRWHQAVILDLKETGKAKLSIERNGKTQNNEEKH